MKERVVDRRFDPLVVLGRKILRRDQLQEVAVTASSTPVVHIADSTEPHVPHGVVWHADQPAPVISAMGDEGRLSATEFTLDRSGAASPFGDDQTFPLPVESLRYQPPSSPEAD
jgi:succinate dehydrogenase / fumarate reductase iron-sulfur subunit